MAESNGFSGYVLSYDDKVSKKRDLWPFQPITVFSRVCIGNIAEGRQRQHSKEFLQHLSIAYGSLAEVETHIQIAGRLNYVGEDQIDKLTDIPAEIGRMHNGLRKSIEKRI